MPIVEPSAPAAATGAVRAGAQMIVGTLAVGAALFLAAGTLAWTQAWIYLALLVAILAVYATIILRRHPDLIAERRNPPADAKRWDKPLVAILGAAGPPVLLIVCGLDRRFGWTDQPPEWFPPLGLLLVAAAGSLSAWAVASNRFFSAVVRIQRDRGHHVVDSGPYRFVRHPAYVGSILHLLGTTMTLWSVPGLAIALLQVVLFLVRTSFEDRTLQAELEGYAEYARRVRWRLVPGCW